MRCLAVMALATAAGGIASAGNGKVIRIEAEPSREVFVPAGSFWMGVSEGDIDEVAPMCEMFFEPMLQALTSINGRTGTICGSWRDELANMLQRQVFLSAY